MREKLVILEGNEIPNVSETGTGFIGEQQAEDKAIQKLEKAWPLVMERLRSIVQNDTEVQAGEFFVDSVEFGISVEAGFDFVISGTATADAKITFKRK
jgi:hypothetical protein